MVRDEIIQSGGQCISVQTDITDLDQCENLINKTIKTFGQLDILVLNAGISMWSPFHEIRNIGFFKDLMETNYHGAVNCVYAGLSHLQKTNGLIVSVSSGQAIIGFPNHAGYTASKHALKGFTDSLEIELGKSIRFMDVILGWVRGTNLRANAFDSEGNHMGEKKKKDNKESISVEACVDGIIQGILSNKRTVYLPWKLRLIPYLKIFFPNFLNRKFSKAVHQQK